MSTFYFPPRDYFEVPPASMSNRYALARVLWDSAETLTSWRSICMEAEYRDGDLSRQIRDEYFRLADAVLATPWIAVQREGEVGTGDPFTCADLGHEQCDGSHPDHFEVQR